MPALAFGLAVIAAAVYVARTASPAELIPAAVSVPAAAAPTPQTAVAARAAQAPRRWQQAEPRPLPPTEEEQAHSKQVEDEAVQTRIHDLNELAMSGDPKSLRAILGELNNTDPRLRWAAADAAAQFESQDAIPALKDALAQASDVDEMVHLQNAIKFLGNVTPPETGAVRAGPP
ncbi:MAG TPA: HEAT repeat domain-containing protein [Verrucomicrobiae bacterium]|jgi:hypothetical protein